MVVKVKTQKYICLALLVLSLAITAGFAIEYIAGETELWRLISAACISLCWLNLYHLRRRKE